MITEMAKIESRKALADLTEVINEKELNNIIDLLKVVKRDFGPNYKKTLIQCVAEASSSMMWRQHECEHAEIMKSINKKIDRLKLSFDGREALKIREDIQNAEKRLTLRHFDNGISLRSDPSPVPENTKHKKSTLKVITGGISCRTGESILKK